MKKHSAWERQHTCFGHTGLSHIAGQAKQEKLEALRGHFQTESSGWRKHVKGKMDKGQQMEEKSAAAMQQDQNYEHKVCIKAPSSSIRGHNSC